MKAALWSAAVITAGAVGYGTYVEVNDPRLALGRVDVAGSRHTPIALVIAAAAFPAGRNIWLLETGASVRRIEALPWILNAKVKRAWPNRVGIAVTERTPVARVVLPAGGNAEEPSQEVAIVDASMRVLATSPADQADARLPLLRVSPPPVDLRPGADAEKSVASAYDALVQFRALGLRISEVQIAPATGIGVSTADGLRVIFGSIDDIGKKVSLYKAITAKIAAPENVVYVDLRSVRAPTVLYR